MKKKISWAVPLIEEEERNAVKEVMNSEWISGTNPFTDNFEKIFACKVQAKYAVAVCNGTAGLILGYLAIREKLQLTVSVPSWTYIASVNTSQLFGKTSLTDSDKRSFTIDPSLVPATNIVMPVNIGGVPPDYDAFKEKHKFIFADSAEGMGSTYKGNPEGSQADLHMFSLHATKIVTSGEGGMLTTNDKELYERLKALNNQGYSIGRSPADYNHGSIGYNFRMPSLQAAIGMEQLKKLQRFIKHRKEIAKIYHEYLDGFVDYQECPKYGTSPFFLFTILVEPKEKEKVIKACALNNIQVKSWKPIHLQPPYLRYKLSFPNAEWLFKRNIHLPIHNKLTEEEAMDVAEVIQKVLK